MAGDGIRVGIPLLHGALGALVPGICLFAIGMKNLAGREHPMADGVITVVALIIAIVNIGLSVLAFFVFDLQVDSSVGAGGQPKNIDDIEWVLYFGDIDTGAEKKESTTSVAEKKQLPDDERYCIMMDVALDYEYIHISNNSYFDWQNVILMVNGKYFVFKDMVLKGENSVPWTDFISDDWESYDRYSEATDSLVIHIGDIYVDGNHFSGDEYNMDFAYTTGGDTSTGNSGRAIAPKN